MFSSSSCTSYTGGSSEAPCFRGSDASLTPSGDRGVYILEDSSSGIGAMRRNNE